MHESTIAARDSFAAAADLLTKAPLPRNLSHMNEPLRDEIQTQFLRVMQTVLFVDYKIHSSSSLDKSADIWVSIGETDREAMRLYFMPCPDKEESFEDTIGRLAKDLAPHMHYREASFCLSSNPPCFYIEYEPKELHTIMEAFCSKAAGEAPYISRRLSLIAALTERYEQGYLPAYKMN